MAYQPLSFNTKTLWYIYIKYIWFGLVLWHINHCRLFNVKSSFYMYIKYVWFGLVGWFLWYINYCWLFNAKSSLYIYIKYTEFGLVEFCGISTIVGYLMPDPLNTYILNIWFVNILVITFLNKPEFLFCTVKWFYSVKWSNSSISTNLI